MFICITPYLQCEDCVDFVDLLTVIIKKILLNKIALIGLCSQSELNTFSKVFGLVQAK